MKHRRRVLIAALFLGSGCTSSAPPSSGTGGSVSSDGPFAMGGGSGGASGNAGGGGPASSEGIGGTTGLTGTQAPGPSAGGSPPITGVSPADAGEDAPAPVTRPLTIFFVDTEGGQATVIHLPNEQVLMIDSGNAGMRDGERILAVIQGELAAPRIDYLLTTHYDSDHVGGVPYLSSRIEIAQYFDHGNAGAPAQYLAAANAAARRSLVAGDVLELGGATLEVVAAGGDLITEPLRGAGMPNPFCEGAVAAVPNDPRDENANSVGVVLRHGEFDFLDLGDLLWFEEHALACPNHLLGPIDLYLTTHHGLTRSGAPQLVRGTEPLAAIMNNGPRKGGGGATWNALSLAPGGGDVWQVHRTVTAPDTQNAPPDQIANLGEGQADQAFYLKVIAESRGEFTVLNPRTGFSKTYRSTR